MSRTLFCCLALMMIMQSAIADDIEMELGVLVDNSEGFKISPRRVIKNEGEIRQAIKFVNDNTVWSIVREKWFDEARDMKTLEHVASGVCKAESGCNPHHLVYLGLPGIRFKRIVKNNTWYVCQEVIMVYRNIDDSSLTLMAAESISDPSNNDRCGNIQLLMDSVKNY